MALLPELGQRAYSVAYCLAQISEELSICVNVKGAKIYDHIQSNSVFETKALT